MYYIKIVSWIICFSILIDISFSLLNESSSIANIIGFAIMAFNIWMTAKTKCFLNINFKKNKKD